MYIAIYFLYFLWQDSPNLQDIVGRYDIQPEMVKEATIPEKLEIIREHIRRQIRKELKIKEGAENLKKVTTGTFQFEIFEIILKFTKLSLTYDI